MVTPQMAELMRNLHPLRLQYEAFSSQNPLMKAVKMRREKARENRKPVVERQSVPGISGADLEADRSVRWINGAIRRRR